MYLVWTIAHVIVLPSSQALWILFAGMNIARLLLALKQGTRSLEDYIQEYLSIAYYSDLPDCLVIEFFCEGINQPLMSKLRREGPRSSLCQFMDYALLCVGSPFTVGVTEEERDTTSVTEMADGPERTHKMAATTTHRRVSADRHETSQVTVDLRESSQVTFDLHEASQVTTDRHESSQVTVDLCEASQVTVDLHEASQVTADHQESCHVTADRLESCHVLSVAPRSSRSVLRYPSLVSSVRDAPLVSARTAGIPKPTHFNPPVPELIPLSEALAMVGIALCCVWAVYTTTELPQAMAPAAAYPEVVAHAAEPLEAAVLASAPCMVVATSNVLSACRVAVKGTVTTVEPPEVVATTAEPSEVSVVSTHQLLSCPVAARRAVPELSSCPFTAMEAICESSSCPVTAKEAVCESSSRPVATMEAVCELFACPVAARRAVPGTLDLSCHG